MVGITRLAMSESRFIIFTGTRFTREFYEMECEKMSAILDIKSKKGMSLAYVLVICLFLMMITGGIVSVALLQHNETGSDLNVRQAYISAKSGLDTMQDSLKDKVITESDLPSGAGGEKYYVMYTDSSGQLHYEYRTTEDAIKTVLATVEADNTKELVGGEGTYFKIKKTDSTNYKVTALNKTGKYNANTTINEGDLSIGFSVYDTYTFGNPRPVPREPLEYYDPDDGGTDFLMVGMQNAVNEKRSGDASAYKTLNSMHKINSGGYGGGAGSQEIYVLDTQANSDVSTSYAPLVYDKTVRLTSQKEHSQVAAYNEGIYLLGDATGDEINEYAGHSVNLGQTSFFTQNGEYAPEFKCAFMVISHNINAVDQSTVLNYYGSKSGRNYVYVYLENNVTFNMCRSGEKWLDRSATFTKGRGWYRFYTDGGGYMFNPDKWVACSAPSESEMGCKNHLGRIRTIQNSGGTLHSGGPETQKLDINVNILNWNGLYNSGSGGSTPSSGTDNAYIYCSPCKAPYSAETYTWSAKEFNLYWTGTGSFKLTNGAKILGQGKSFVITTLKNNIIEKGGTSESFKIASDMIHIMNKIKVVYDGKSYEIAKGTYSLFQVIADGNKPEAAADSYQKKIAEAGGVELFSDAAKEFFEATQAAPVTPVTPETHTGGGVIHEADEVVLLPSIFDSASGEYIIPKEQTGKIIYFNPDAEKNYHIIQVSGEFTLKRELADGSVIDLIIFKDAGKYRIPVTSGSNEATDGIELTGELLNERSTWTPPTYDCLDVAQKTGVSGKGYY